MENRDKNISGVDCPLCKEQNILAFNTFSFNEISSKLDLHLSDNNIDAINNELKDIWQRESVSICQCESCKLVFSLPFVAGTAKLYSLIYQNQEIYPEWKWDFEITKQQIEKLFELKSITSESTLLEIGAGNGSFVNGITDYIKKDNIDCTEYSEYGCNTIRQNGINCTQDNLHSLKIPSSKYDIICMFQVLEHLDSLHEVFTKINEIINENGHLFITVPNDKYRAIMDSIGIFMDLPPVHISRWSFDSFKTLSLRYGWEIIDYQRQSSNTKGKALKVIALIYHKKWKYKKRIETVSSTILKRSLRLLSFIVIAIKYFDTMLKLSNKSVSISQWVYLKKK